MRLSVTGMGNTYKFMGKDFIPGPTTGEKVGGRLDEALLSSAGRTVLVLTFLMVSDVHRDYFFIINSPTDLILNE